MLCFKTLFLCSVLVCTRTTAYSGIWRLSMVSMERAAGVRGGWQKDIAAFNRWEAAKKCHGLHRCTTICALGPNSYSISDARADPYTVDTFGLPNTECWTTHPESLFSSAGSSLMASDHYSSNINTLLFTGLYFGKYSECYVSGGPTSFPYLLVDLGAPKTITRVLVMSPRNGLGLLNFGNLEIRLGLTVQSGNFSGYTLIGSLPTANPSEGFILEGTASPPIEARYISVQTMATNRSMHLCYMAVY